MPSVSKSNCIFESENKKLKTKNAELEESLASEQKVSAFKTNRRLQAAARTMTVPWRFWSRYRQKYWIFTNSLTKKKGKLPMIDEWSGFCRPCWPNLIVKYASELDVENLPASGDSA